MHVITFSRPYGKCIKCNICKLAKAEADHMCCVYVCFIKQKIMRHIQIAHRCCSEIKA